MEPAQALIHGLNRHYYSIAINYRKTELEERMLLNLQVGSPGLGLGVWVWPVGGWACGWASASARQWVGVGVSMGVGVRVGG